MLASTLKEFSLKKKNTMPRKLVEDFKNNKVTLNIFKELKVGEKLGKQEKNGKKEYYKVIQYAGMFISRWYYGEGRMRTIEYLDNDFSIFMQYLDELIKHLEIDPFCFYVNLSKDTKTFVDEILPGLYSLKKTYPECKKMVAKVDSIILTLIDFKDKADDLIVIKEKSKANLFRKNPSSLRNYEI